MANPYGYQFSYSFVPGLWQVFMKVNIGATGAPTLVTANGASKGVASITRNGAGDYSIVLNEAWKSLLMVEAVFDAGASAPASPTVSIKSNAVSSTKTLRILCTAAGVATDPASGEVMYLKITLKQSSAY